MRAIEDGESIPGHPDGSQTRRPLAFRCVGALRITGLGDLVEVVRAVIGITRTLQDNRR